MNNRWAYHGTSILKAYSDNKLKIIENLHPREIGKTHLKNIAENGLIPKQSTRQTLYRRKKVLGKRFREKFIYFYTQPLTFSDVYMMAINYGDGLVIKNGGAILRFPLPKSYWKDPDEQDEESNIFMTTDPISPEKLQILIPPAKYYELLGGKGNKNWSAWDIASRYLRQFCINNEKYWQILLQENEIINPWINQEDLELEALN